MQARPDIFTDKGGDTIQLIKTRQALQSLGVIVDVSTDFEPDLDNYDIVHLFNLKLVESTYLQFLNAKKQGKPIAFSTIYWRLSEEENQEFSKQLVSIYGKFRMGYLQKAKNTLKKLKYLQPAISFYTKIKENKRYQPHIFYRLRQEIGERKMQMQVLQEADILLPNSESEMGLIRKDFGVNKDYVVIPNGVDLGYESANGDYFYKKYGLKDFILCVARIEERKNQLSVIRALKDIDIPLVFIGRGREPYFSKCKREAGKNVYFLGHLEGSELASAYAAAKIHVLPSWYETPGLSNLEAALAGCNIVVTRKGATEEYFGNYAEYCEPNDIRSIREAILKAMNKPYPAKLEDIIKENYTWNSAAQKTLEAYYKIMHEYYGYKK